MSHKRSSKKFPTLGGDWLTQGPPKPNIEVEIEEEDFTREVNPLAIIMERINLLDDKVSYLIGESGNDDEVEERVPEMAPPPPKNFEELRDCTRRDHEKLIAVYNALQEVIIKQNALEKRLSRLVNALKTQ